MTRIRRKTAGLIAGIVVAVAISAGAGALWWRSDSLPSTAAFRADGRVVTIPQLQSWASSMHALYGVQIPDEPTQQAKFWRAAAKSMAVETVVAGAARKVGVSVTQSQANTYLAQYVASVYGSGETGQQAFASALINAGTSLPAVESEFRRVLLDERLFAKVTEKTSTPNTSQLQAGFLRWSCHLGTPESRHIQNIVVLDTAAATAVKRALSTGTPWGVVVRRWSQDSTTAAKAGDLGWQSAASLQSQFAAAAFAATPGEIFGPVKTTVGYDIGRVLAIRPASPPTLEASHTQVTQWIQAQQASDVWSTWIDQQLRAGDVQYASKYSPDASTKTTSAAPALGSVAPAACPKS
ncbi:MAG: PpiC-type peptidyl-prolyl cis-trans isomerase [Marmoricola sp.]|nr:PpiC-type peptidyl-prolyl cis-trans isomerase [Marmoricola sp.]